MRRVLLVVVAVAALAGAAVAQIGLPPMVPYSVPGGPMLGRNGPMIPNTQSTPTPPPVGCNGVADFGDGCAIAVFGH